eukprot:scaffold79182_cov51-Prasinocladus_malaysianus.AAC.4
MKAVVAAVQIASRMRQDAAAMAVVVQSPGSLPWPRARNALTAQGAASASSMSDSAAADLPAPVAVQCCVSHELSDSCRRCATPLTIPTQAM